MKKIDMLFNVGLVVFIISLIAFSGLKIGGASFGWSLFLSVIISCGLTILFVGSLNSFLQDFKCNCKREILEVDEEVKNKETGGQEKGHLGKNVDMKV